MLGLFAKVQYVWEDSIDFYQRAKVLLFQIPSVIFRQVFLIPPNPHASYVIRFVRKDPTILKKKRCV